MSAIKFHQDLKVYQKSFKTAMIIFELSKSFSKEQQNSQIRDAKQENRRLGFSLL
ncbi:four helix bundle protein [Chryseobacterium fluminis]|uniref:four helix bundle protein n=1 Tax=Chryseobacterium fluminis TaxID=2983606 RepID=UPI0022531649|nr:four helix bundle protein [Chryseobacterium sp. MMS21-Ot14]UZT96805.1 four helix bundle protein [Chryseobacterium sp. MMS21-Ot14]